MMRSHKTHVGAVIAACLALIAVTPAADAKPHLCDLKVDLGASTINFDNSSQPSFQVTVRRTKPNQECNFWVGISRGSASSYTRELKKGSASIKYGVFKSPCTPSVPNCSNVQMKDGVDATQIDEVHVGSFVKQQWIDTVTFTVYPVFALESVNSLSTSNQLKPWGVYSDSISVRVYEEDFPVTGVLPSPDDTKTVSVQKTIDKFAVVSIVDKGQPYQDPPVPVKTIDFGTMTPNEVGEFDLISLFNAGYRLELSSSNGGVLKASAGQATVPYEFRVDGALKPLPKGSAILLGSSGGVSPAPTVGVRNRISVTIPASSLAGAMGGTYQDTLTVTIQSTE